MITPSRYLNEPNLIFGLSVIDMAIVGYVLALSHSILERYNLSILAFVLAAFTFGILAGVRLKYRKKSVRDFLRFYLRQLGCQ